jgi:hypothetical protein
MLSFCIVEKSFETSKDLNFKIRELKWMYFEALTDLK